jgi:hypothetical protein
MKAKSVIVTRCEAIALEFFATRSMNFSICEGDPNPGMPFANDLKEGEQPWDEALS